jgi:hypothetical protein
LVERRLAADEADATEFFEVREDDLRLGLPSMVAPGLRERADVFVLLLLLGVLERPLFLVRAALRVLVRLLGAERLLSAGLGDLDPVSTGATSSPVRSMRSLVGWDAVPSEAVSSSRSILLALRSWVWVWVLLLVLWLLLLLLLLLLLVLLKLVRGEYLLKVWLVSSFSLLMLLLLLLALLVLLRSA